MMYIEKGIQKGQRKDGSWGNLYIINYSRNIVQLAFQKIGMPMHVLVFENKKDCLKAFKDLRKRK